MLDITSPLTQVECESTERELRFATRRLIGREVGAARRRGGPINDTECKLQKPLRRDFQVKISLQSVFTTSDVRCTDQWEFLPLPTILRNHLMRNEAFPSVQAKVRTSGGLGVVLQSRQVHELGSRIRWIGLCTAALGITVALRFPDVGGPRQVRGSFCYQTGRPAAHIHPTSHVPRLVQQLISRMIARTGIEDDRDSRWEGRGCGNPGLETRGRWSEKCTG
jgi:hypothetical protein